jgi:hypothetical protein
VAAVTVYPYLRPQEGRVVLTQWRFAPQDTELPAHLADWDPNTNLSISCTANVDVPGVFKDCDLKRSDVVAIGASWHSTGTSLRGAGTLLQLDSGVLGSDLQLVLDMPGHLLASEVMLETSLFLAVPQAAGRPPLAPSIAGSILWKSQAKLVLEGRGARFPVEVMDFARSGWLPANAAWHLDWNPESPEATFLAGVRLFLNSAHPAVARAINPTIHTEADNNVLSAMYFDLGRQMVLGMLGNSDFVADPQTHGKGSLGYHALALIRRLFPGEALDALHARAKNRVQFFESELQAKLRLFWK